MINLHPSLLEDLPRELVEAIEYYKKHPEFGVCICRDVNNTDWINEV